MFEKIKPHFENTGLDKIKEEYEFKKLSVEETQKNYIQFPSIKDTQNKYTKIN